MMYANDRVHYDPMVVFVCLHITLPHKIIVEMHLNVLNFYNTCQVHSVESMYQIKSLISITFHAIYGAVFIQLTHFYDDDCENMCTLFHYHHHQIRSMAHFPLFSASSWINAMCCMSFYILCGIEQRSSKCKCSSCRCDLCLSEKTIIAMVVRSYLLSECAEILSTCRHKIKFRYYLVRRVKMKGHVQALNPLLD